MKKLITLLLIIGIMDRCKMEDLIAIIIEMMMGSADTTTGGGGTNPGAQKRNKSKYL